MFEFLTKLFDTSDFPARWHCGTWSDALGWLHIMSDLATFAAYMAIPIVLAYFVTRRRDLPFPRVFWLFAAFIFTCGTVHLIEAIIFWSPVYRLSGVMKLATATMSWATVVAVIPVTKSALNLRSPREMQREIDERRKAQSQLKSNEQLLRRLLDLQERERQMVAHDIHDGFVQDVVGAHMRLEALHDTLDSSKAESTWETTESLLTKAISEGRRLIRDLRPMVIDEAGIVEAIRHLIADEQEKGILTIAFDADVHFGRLEPMLEGAVFRIVQEALTNAGRHSQNHHAAVQLSQEEDMLRIEIRDRGVGFDPQKVPADRFGLRGITERARMFGGDATIESTPGEGTVIRVQLPLQPDD